MRKRGQSRSKGDALPVAWPEGAWARIQIKRPIEHASERYIFKDELTVGRASNLADDDFRIDLQQVSGSHCSIRRGPGKNQATVFHKSASNPTQIVKGDIIAHKLSKHQVCEAVICRQLHRRIHLHVVIATHPFFSDAAAPRQSAVIHASPQMLFTAAPSINLPAPSPLDSERTDTQQNSFSFLPESSNSSAAAASGVTSHAARAVADSPPFVEGGEDCILSSHCRGRGSQGPKKRSLAKISGGSASAARQSGGSKPIDEVPDSDDGGNLSIQVPHVPQRAGGGLNEHPAPRLNQRQAAAERIDCTDFESQLGVIQRSSASSSTSAAVAAAAEEIDRLHRSVKQHVEKIRTLELDLTKSNQEVAMLKLQNGSSEHQKILEQLKSETQSKSIQIEKLKAHTDSLAASTKDLNERLMAKDEEVRRLCRDVEAARSETLRAAAAAAVAAQTNVSPERPNKERELQTQLSSKDCEIRRLNDRLVSVSEQAAGSGRLLCELQQEKDRVRELTSEVQELQRQLLQQQDEIKTQNLQANSRFLELQSQLQVLRQRCDASDRDNLAKVAEAAAARKRSSEHESQLNALRRQLENAQLQLHISQTNESNMKGQLESERKLHLVDAQAAEELKQFARKMYYVLKDGALMLEKVPSSLGAACPSMKFDSCSGSASRDDSYSQ